MAAELGPRTPSGKRYKEIQGPLLFSVGGRRCKLGWAEGGPGTMEERRPRNTCPYCKWAEDLINIPPCRTKAWLKTAGSRTEWGMCPAEPRGPRPGSASS